LTRYPSPPAVWQPPVSLALASFALTSPPITYNATGHIPGCLARIQARRCHLKPSGMPCGVRVILQRYHQSIQPVRHEGGPFQGRHRLPGIEAYYSRHSRSNSAAPTPTHALCVAIAHTEGPTLALHPSGLNTTARQLHSVRQQEQQHRPLTRRWAGQTSGNIIMPSQNCHRCRHWTMQQRVQGQQPQKRERYARCVRPATHTYTHAAKHKFIGKHIAVGVACIGAASFERHGSAAGVDVTEDRCCQGWQASKQAARS
jgi:hypothetical protein